MATPSETNTQIRSSSLRRQYFASVLEILNEPNLQLLRDVDTRWSSTFLMIERALLLREVSNTNLTLKKLMTLDRLLNNFLKTMTMLSCENSSLILKTGKLWKFSRKYFEYT